MINSFEALSWGAIPVVLTLAGLEIVLSADNAVILAVLARNLKPELRRRALFYGIAGAFVLRFLAIFCAVWLIRFWWLQIAGGGYLVWLAINHLTGGEQPPDSTLSTSSSFWRTVVLIEIADLAFAVDSVLAAVGVSDNVFIIYSGAVIGLVAMRFAAVAVMRLLDNFPQLKAYAYVLVAWIGLKLMLQGTHLYCLARHSRWQDFVHLSAPVFWLVTVVIAATAILHWLRQKEA